MKPCLPNARRVGGVRRFRAPWSLIPLFPNIRRAGGVRRFRAPWSLIPLFPNIRRAGGVRRLRAPWSLIPLFPNTRHVGRVRRPHASWFLMPLFPNARRVGGARRPVMASRGFTLIEVMVVVIIISVIVASVLFSVDLTSNQKTRSAVFDVQLLMQGLSNEAILEGDHYGIKWERAAQRFMPVVETARGWSAYSSGKGERPAFRPVSWKGFAEIAMTVGGTSFDGRLKDDESFYTGRDKEEELERPLVEFQPTGLWEPAGEIEFFVGGNLYATLEWTASGKMSLEHGDAP